MSGGDGLRFTRRAVYFGLLFESSLMLLALALGWLFNQPALASLTWVSCDGALGVGIAAPMLFGLVLLTRVRFPPFVRLRRLFDTFARPFFAPYTVLDLALLSATAGIGEEMLFRGVIQAVLHRWWGVWVALFAASVLFGLLHALTPTYAILAILAGVYLGGVWLLTENLLVVIIAHAVYDFLALLYLLRLSPPMEPPATDPG
jgi:membrane protease YdiL (CAAX protease family)